MIIFPAIDLKDGQCVRLVQGKAEKKIVYSDRPAQIAASFEKAGTLYLHIVDLDGAFTGSPKNHKAIRSIADAIGIPFQLGGGLRRREDVEKAIQLGAARVIIGTSAISRPDFIKELLDEYGSERVVLDLSARDGLIAIEGWVSVSDVSAVQLARQMKGLGIKTAVYTDVSRDGLLAGPNFKAIKAMAVNSGLDIIASGGVSSLDNVHDLKNMENLGVVGVIIGKAIYDGKINLEEALALVKNN